jgi:hypothetical protein
MRKLTAVEWLYELSKERELDKFDLEQAKEMEKQQITTFARHWWAYGSDLTPVDYYEKTFNK